MALHGSKEQAEIPQYPEVNMICEDCGMQFIGKVGPIQPGLSYNLVEYVWPWENESAQRQMKSHHMTNRIFSRGHNSFNVELNGAIVGKIKMSSDVQRYESL